MSTIGFIGLGHMGFPMVKNLLKNNYSVRVYDISKQAMDSCVSAGAQAAKSSADAATNVDVVITVLQTGEQVKQCCFGEQGIFAHLKSNALFIDCSSIDVQSSRELHSEAKTHKIAMVDAPVSGGVMGAENATLTIMVGGDENNFQRAEKILKHLGKKIIYAGGDGNGVAAKICNNMIMGISMIGVSEGFILADKLGLGRKKNYLKFVLAHPHNVGCSQTIALGQIFCPQHLQATIINRGLLQK